MEINKIENWDRSKLYKRSEVSRKTGIPVTKLNKWEKQGKVTPENYIGKKKIVCYTYKEVEDILRIQVEENWKNNYKDVE